MNDEHWKEEYKSWKTLRPSLIKLLDEGASSLSQTWLLNSMWCEWKDLKESGGNNPPLPAKRLSYKDPWED